MLGKALGGGLPFGATMAGSDLIPPEYEREPWVAFTFHNEPIGAAAALAVLEIVERERLPERRRSSARGPPSGQRAAGSLLVHRRRPRPGLLIGIDLVVDRDTR